MNKLMIVEGVKQDLAAIKEVSSFDAIYIATLIQSIKEDEDLLERLMRPGSIYVDDIELNVCDLTEALKRYGICLSRIKIIDMPRPRGPKKYRIIFAFDGRSRNDTYYIMGVMNRSTNYDITSPIFNRIIKDYDEIGLYRVRPINR